MCASRSPLHMNIPPRPLSSPPAPNPSSPTMNSGDDAPRETDMSWQVKADLEALREREANLREYENWLRTWQAQLDTERARMSGTSSETPSLRVSSGAPVPTDASLDAAWEKFYRARSLMEAEQNQMRDDRMMLRDAETTLKRREAELAEREARLAEAELRMMEREQRVSVAEGMGPEKGKAQSSTVQRLAQAPFMVARSVFGPTT